MRHLHHKSSLNWDGLSTSHETRDYRYHMESSAEVMAPLLPGTVEETCLWVSCVVSGLLVDINVLAERKVCHWALAV